ncbi:MAG: hypothetical protein KAJ50_04640, partial [Bacteroidales bacterium]|nr:hypothetical protein [Bacteroidales bacterium]
AAVDNYAFWVLISMRKEIETRLINLALVIDSVCKSLKRGYLTRLNYPDHKVIYQRCPELW